MGLDASAKLLYGVSLEHHIVQVQVTKYNEDTGKPYKKPIDKEFFQIRGTSIKMSLDDGWVHYCDYNDKNSYFFGIIISETNSHNRSMAGNKFTSELWEEAQEVTNEIKASIVNRLKSFGYNGNINLYVLQCLSY